MSSHRWVVVVAMLVSVCGALSSSATEATDQTLRAQLHDIMMRMDKSMTIPAQGSVDADFVAVMVPHHQAAIDMARVQLRYSHNPQIVRLCQEIIIEQQQEIEVMRRALDAQS